MKLNRHVVAATFSIFLPASFLASQETQAPSSGLALTPPMGWNSWNKFACNVSEDLIKGTADAMVKSGMKDAGYEYVVIDPPFQATPDPNINIYPDPQHSPH